MPYCDWSVAKVLEPQEEGEGSDALNLQATLRDIDGPFVRCCKEDDSLKRLVTLLAKVYRRPLV